MDVSNVFLEGVIRGGAFGQVFLVQSATTGMQYALKQQPFVLDGMDQLRLELQVHTRGDPNFVVKALAAWDHNNFCYTLFEHTLGNLTMFLMPNEHQIVSVVHQMGKAISYIHGCGYIHRDLQPRSILVDTKYNIKLSEFGHCVQTRSVSDGKLCGSAEYMAPESLLDSVYAEESDWFAFGLLVHYLLTNTELHNFENFEVAKRHWANAANLIIFDLVVSRFWQSYLAKFVARRMSNRHRYSTSLADLAPGHPMLLNSGYNIQKLGNLYVRAVRLGECDRRQMVVQYDHPELYIFDEDEEQAIQLERVNGTIGPVGMFPLYIPPQ
ncbi:unnamed protein product [Allacma fusca]|uniref:Serine/threonine-protein kinase greatwall n=1 Tax=Allacma fusca TaxID=39272 RepID=A0A8J2LB53_9HEXA|nr:unnamed protein product [Allacma fusca]